MKKAPLTLKLSTDKALIESLSLNENQIDLLQKLLSEEQESVRNDKPPHWPYSCIAERRFYEEKQHGG